MNSRRPVHSWPQWRGRRFCAAVPVLCGLLAATAPAAEPSAPLREAHLRLLYSDSMFMTVKRSDALAAIKVWVENLGRRRGFALSVETGAYERLDEVQARIRNGSVDMIICTSLEYLQLAPNGEIEAQFVPGWSQATDDYVVLTRRDGKIASLADLRGKRVVFYRVGSGLGRLWLESVLRAQGLGSVGEFFGASSETTRVSAAILPVFFGQADVAVAKRYGWETMKEMNPQLAARLQILAHSPVLPDGVICLLRSGREHPFREDLLRGTLEMSDDPQGQQILLLFKTEKMVPFSEEHLSAVQKMYPWHIQLTSAATPPAGPTGLSSAPNQSLAKE